MDIEESVDARLIEDIPVKQGREIPAKPTMVVPGKSMVPSGEMQPLRTGSVPFAPGPSSPAISRILRH
jgi:hypothetical protein